MKILAVTAPLALALACSAPVGPAPVAGDAGGATPTADDPATARTYRVVALATGGDCPARLEGDWTRAPGAGEEEARIAVGAYRLMAELGWSSPDRAEGRASVRASDCYGEYSVTVSAPVR